ncbi:hypothetical protein J6590_102741 [Homalodisca vitripennis]|nr:hypothetical protein J6590_102741 [Homalodisca vitripennis]
MFMTRPSSTVEQPSYLHRCMEDLCDGDDMDDLYSVTFVNATSVLRADADEDDVYSVENAVSIRNCGIDASTSYVYTCAILRAFEACCTAHALAHVTHAEKSACFPGKQMSSDKQTVDFIEDYRHYSVLWDIKDKCYTNKNKRNDAYHALGEKYKMSEKGVKSKIKNLCSYFSKEQQKMSQRKSGASADDVYQSSWFAYKHLLFLGDSITPRTTKDSLEDTITEEVEIGEDNC